MPLKHRYMNEFPTSSATSHEEQIVQLLTEHQNLLLGFIRTSVSDWFRAKDILQEVNAVIWRKSAEFELGTNFKSWALHIARFQILSSYRDQQREKLLFDDEVIAEIASDAEELDPQGCEQESRLDALEQCVGELPPPQREMLEKRYFSGDGVANLAASLGRSTSAVKMILLRARRSLLECINLKTRNSDAL